ncbi:MAG: AAA family ATPase [Candidatus Marinimicrobia bacterium]|jgi:phosphate starvation-inducible PhoH-like protein|nr:AAA family ATPase [Candidatus Neomarinimicrobiota bacterium]MBT4154931.1 AAA family ATPase [Candidatus Neomarinimicrobiota bacterium]MBT4753375.1 AAA family ATPase [Candidatus Neomarinimicrobiota bacterium]|tara:strand:+ start:3127 stop:4092 length:966 start_codon:yes stop_codon:yes gene_type:complete
MEKTIELKTLEPTALLGVADSHIKLIEAAIPITIIARGEVIKIQGDTHDVDHAHEVLHEMMETLSSKGSLSVRDVQNLIRLITSSNGKSNGEHHTPDLVIHYGKKGAIVPKTNGQENYVKTVYKNDVVFCIGPAGTGKTFLAVALAVAALENNEVDRIILCRPAVEAGEHLGFLPGDLKEKVDPYLAPLYDSLGRIFPENKLAQLLEKNYIEVVPLAYMRGRTLDSAYMILDEAQNATALQMKMFLTRLGIGSQAIVTGDITQIDLKKRSDSGLIQVTNILNNVEGIGFITLDPSDVVRHSLVMKIIQAYDENLKNEDSSN